MSSEAWASKLKAQAISASKRASIASRAAATRSTRESVPNSGPMKIAARRSVSPSMKRPSAPTYSPGHGFRRGKADRVALLGLLDAGRAQMLEHHLGEIGRRHDLVQAPARALGGVDEVDQLLFVDGHDAVRRQALDRERPGDAHVVLSS